MISVATHVYAVPFLRMSKCGFESPSQLTEMSHADVSADNTHYRQMRKTNENLISKPVRNGKETKVSLAS